MTRSRFPKPPDPTPLTLPKVLCSSLAETPPDSEPPPPGTRNGLPSSWGSTTAAKVGGGLYSAGMQQYS